MTLIYPIFAAVICAVIEFIRIMKSWGLPNVNKLWTITIGVIFFAICLALSVTYYDDIRLYLLLIYAMYYAACRGVIYDILLNLFRGVGIGYKSSTTNSQLDQMLVRFDFWLLKSFYLVLCILSGLLWVRLK